MTISPRHLDLQYLKESGLNASEAQLLYTINSSSPDYENSAYDPELISIFKPIVNDFYKNIEKYIDCRNLQETNSNSKEISPPTPKFPGEVFCDSKGYLLQTGVALELIQREFQFKLTQTIKEHELKQGLSIFKDQPKRGKPGDLFEEDEVVQRILSMFRATEYNPFTDNLNKSIFNYCTHEWCDVNDYYSTPRAIEQKRAYIFKNESNKRPNFDVDSIRSIYGLSFINFSKHYTVDERNACLQTFVRTADAICEKLGFKDKALFGQVGTMGLRFAPPPGGIFGSYHSASYTMTINDISIGTIAHEYGHRLDHIACKKAINIEYTGINNDGMLTRYTKSRKEDLKDKAATPDKYFLNESIYSAMSNIIDTIDPQNIGTLHNESYTRGKLLSNLISCATHGDLPGAVATLNDLSANKVYWSNKHELFARHFSSFIAGDSRELEIDFDAKRGLVGNAIHKQLNRWVPLKIHTQSFLAFANTISTEFESVYSEQLIEWHAKNIKSRTSVPNTYMNKVLNPKNPTPLAPDMLALSI